MVPHVPTEIANHPAFSGVRSPGGTNPLHVVIFVVEVSTIHQNDRNKKLYTHLIRWSLILCSIEMVAKIKRG